MSHAIRTATFLCLALLPLSTATARAGDPRPDPEANAALKYWQAFALLPALDKDQEKILEQWNTVPLDAAALKLIESSQRSREASHRAAALRRCDWGLNYDDGIFMVLPHLIKLRTLARLTALHARWEFAQGHRESGWNDVTDLLTLARHGEVDPVMIGQLVGYTVEMMAIEAALPALPRLKSVLPMSAAALDALRQGPTLRQLVLMEKQLGPVWLIRQLKEAEQRKKGSWQEVWKRISDVIVRAEERNARDREVFQSIKTFEQAIGTLEGLLTFYDELASMTDLPWDAFDARYTAFIAKATAANPLADVSLPNLKAFAMSERRARARRALFQAAIAAVREGPDALKPIKDPFGDGPFEYRPLDGGFELRSKCLSQGKPVTLTVGRTAQP